jgi:hypothetical protein
MSNGQRPSGIHQGARIRDYPDAGRLRGRSGKYAGLGRGLPAALLLLAVPLAVRAEPRTEAVWSANPVRPGQSFTLSVTARWDGDADRYAVGMPKIELPAEIRKEKVSSRSFREGEDNVIAYRWELVAAKKGPIPPVAIKLAVLARGEQEPSEVTLETEPLVVDVARWRGVPVHFALPALAAAILVIGLAVWQIGRRRARLPATDEADPADRASVLAGLKEELDTCRVRGDTPAFLDAAQRLVSITSPGERPEAGEIASLLEQARYGSLRLSSEEMEKWCQRLRRLESTA